MKISVILPARDEAPGLAKILPRLRELYPEVDLLVIDDGSKDNTVEVAESFGARVISHRYSMGNGAAIKTGARNALGDVVVFMDADGQHDPNEIRILVEKLSTGYDMVVGSRDASGHANLSRRFANELYNQFSGWMVGHTIPDLTSGFRAVRTEKLREFLFLLPNEFSYPTTLTMAFFRSGFTVGFVPIQVQRRIGKSHIRPFQDGIRFLLIIFKIGTLFSPLKLFFPISLMFFSSAISYYLYTFLSDHRFTNMGVVLFITSMLIFLVGLVSEQITALMYRRPEK
ncbi:dolichol-phosphate hexosyltransferase [Gammaproteobacteria bacterium]